MNCVIYATAKLLHVKYKFCLQVFNITHVQYQCLHARTSIQSLTGTAKYMNTTGHTSIRHITGQNVEHMWDKTKMCYTEKAKI